MGYSRNSYQLNGTVDSSITSRSGMSVTNCLFVSGSIVLTAALLLVGISFFAPYWLCNINTLNMDKEEKYTEPQKSRYLSGNVNSSHHYPNRGLWAQCGAECQWFWEDDYRLQHRLLTPLKWHIATQVLYFVAAILLLAAEIFARVQLCCEERNSVYWALGIIVLISVLIQLASVATFGAGAAREPYNAISNPKQTTVVLGYSEYDSTKLDKPFLGWSYWTAVVGNILSLIAGIFFTITAISVSRKM